MTRSLASFRVVALCLLAVFTLPLLTGCEPEPRPPTKRTHHLYGTPYQRGFEHGRREKVRIATFFTQLMTTSLLPYFNRERPGISEFLVEYQDPKYDGQFTWEMLRTMALTMEADLPAHVVEELHGIADGSERDYEEILVLNTFADSVLAVRAIAAVLNTSRTPQITEFATSRPGEEPAWQTYEPMMFASWTDVAPDSRVHLRISDPDGVNPQSVRLQLDHDLYVAGDDGVQIETVDDETVEVTLTPAVPMPDAATVALIVQAGDTTIVTEPAPPRARNMRDARIVWTTTGNPTPAEDCPNKGVDDGRTRAQSLAFAVRGQATADGDLLIGQHFTLLDAGTANENAAVFIHHLDDGTSYAYVGWVGMAWGFAGLSSRGVGYACTFSDTLDNAVVRELLPMLTDPDVGLEKAFLNASGTPLGFVMREMMATADTTEDGVQTIKQFQHAMGWQCLLGDKDQRIRSLELSAAVNPLGGDFVPGAGTLVVGGEDNDPLTGEKLPGSFTRDDVRVSVHYQEFDEGILSLIGALAAPLLDALPYELLIAPQHIVSTYWFRSLRTYHLLGDALQEIYGQIDKDNVVTLLRRPELVDVSDSMEAVIIEPAKGLFHVAVGELPATDAPFETHDLNEAGPGPESISAPAAPDSPIGAGGTP